MDHLGTEPPDALDSQFLPGGLRANTDPPCLLFLGLLLKCHSALGIHNLQAPGLRYMSFLRGKQGYPGVDLSIGGS